jgi:hypothetical protein
MKLNHVSVRDGESTVHQMTHCVDVALECAHLVDLLVMGLIGVDLSYPVIGS